MCMATMPSMTLAMKAKSVLAARGMEAEVVGVDPALTRAGCAYGIRFDCAGRAQAERILRGRGIRWGELFGGEEEGGA